MQADYIARLLDQHGFRHPSVDLFFEKSSGHEGSTVTMLETAVVNDSPGSQQEHAVAPTLSSARVQDSAEMPSGADGSIHMAHPIHKDTNAGRQAVLTTWVILPLCVL